MLLLRTPIVDIAHVNPDILGPSSGSGGGMSRGVAFEVLMPPHQTETPTPRYEVRGASDTCRVQRVARR